jgi:hypothetical protein
MKIQGNAYSVVRFLPKWASGFAWLLRVGAANEYLKTLVSYFCKAMERVKRLPRTLRVQGASRLEAEAVAAPPFRSHEPRVYMSMH